MIVRFTVVAMTAVLCLLMTIQTNASIVYFSDFEGTDGGWVSGGLNGDWERGAPSSYDPNDPGLPPSSSFGNGGINQAFSGNELWGTVLGGPQSNSATSGDSSTLTQTFDFSGLSGPIELSFWHYLDSGGNGFDMASVQVNGIEQILFDGTEGTFDDGGTPGDGSDDTVTFVEATVDLSAFAGDSSVTIDFNFSSTTVVARDGWYIDDVLITAVPEPASFALVGLAGFGLMCSRRRQ